MKLDYKRTFLLGFGFFGISVIWSIYNSYVPIFLKEYGISLAMVGLIMTFDNWIAIAIQPWIGFVSDRTRTRIGRRKPFLLVGAPIGAVFFCLIPVLHLNLPQVIGALIALMAVAVIMNIAMALFRTPTIALMPDITPSPLRSQANGIINLMGGLGTAIAFLGGAYLYDAGRGLPFFAAALIMLGAVSMVLLFIREPAEGEFEVEKVEKGVRQGVWPTIKEIISDSDKSALFILLAIFSWFLGYNALETFWTTYGKEFLGIKESTASAMLTYYALSFLVFALPAGFIAGKIGRKRTIMIGLVALTLLFGSAYFTTNLTYLSVMLVAGGIAWALVNVNSLAMVVDIAPQAKLGSYTGLYYFFSMGAAIISPPLVGRLIDVTDYKTMFIVTPVSMLLALLCMTRVTRGEALPQVTADSALGQVGDTDF
jgi:maltose/moltooligosaccharide transporter